MTEWLHSIAKKCGLALTVHPSRIVAQRNELQVEFDEAHGSGDADERARWSAWLLGARLGIDRRTSSYDWSNERPQRPAQNVSERASAYGARLQRLVPVAALHVAESVSGTRLTHVTWGDTAFVSVFLREYQKVWHTFAESDFEAVDFDRQNLEDFSRLALFYESYKPRPSEERYDWGRLRHYSSIEGLTASRALLLPDFDYDAAQNDGYFSVPSRDDLIVVEPATPDGRSASHAALVERASMVYQLALLPFSPRVYGLHRTVLEFPAGTDHPANPGVKTQSLHSIETGRS